MVTSATYFGNRVRLKTLNVWNAGTFTLTNGSTSFTGPGSVGDYVWVVADGVWNACPIASAGTLLYKYLGVGGAAVPGYYSTPDVISVLRGLEMNVSWAVEELYGTDSIFRVDEARHSLKVEANMNYCKWDPGVTVDWANNLLNPSTRNGAVADTNVAYVNGVIYTIIGSVIGAGQTIEIVCGRTYFEGLPFPFPENDFMIRNLKGKASSATMHTY